MSRDTLGALVGRLLRERFPLRNGTGQELALVSWNDGGLSPPGPADEVAAVLCLRRGATFAAQHQATQAVLIDGLVHLEAIGYLFDVPLAGPDGWFVIDGDAYREHELYTELAERLPRWFDTCAASTLAQMPDAIPDDGKPWHIIFDVRYALETFAPRAARPIRPHRRQTVVAEADGTAFVLAAGGVVVWPEDGDETKARAHLTLDDEEVCASGRVRCGEPLLAAVNRVAIAFDAREPFDVAIGAGDVVRKGDVVAQADGRSFAVDVSGRIMRVERYDTEDEEAAIAEIRSIVERERMWSLRRKIAKEFDGQVLTNKVYDDRGNVVFKKGDVVSFETTPTAKELIRIAEALDPADAVQNAFRDLEERPPALLPRAPGLRWGVRHRMRLLIDPRGQA